MQSSKIEIIIIICIISSTLGPRLQMDHSSSPELQMKHKEHLEE
jgi:hypothetical protein